MEKYTIYCTEEQTKKALELGAPIKIKPYVTREKTIDFAYVNTGIIFNCPTAEQMTGWLEEQGFLLHIYQPVVTFSYSVYYISWLTPIKEDDGLSSRKEAILAAIDAALKYLSKIKEE